MSDHSSASDIAFLQRADSYMADLQRQLDAFDPDELEADLALGVLKITFADGRKCIMNRQTAAHQIWLAEGASAWHFTFAPDTGQWLDTKGRGSLVAVLADILSRRLGRAIALA
jgi:CyaY protein